MKFKKTLLRSLILLVLLISITAVSAADLNDTDNIGDDVLKENTTTDLSFVDLNGEIWVQGSNCNLNDDFTFEYEPDYAYTGELI